MKYDVAYETVKEGFAAGKPVDWHTFAQDFCGWDVPEDDGGLAWRVYVQERNQAKAAINKLARANNQPWRLYNYGIGEGVVMQKKHQMFERSLEERMRRVASGFNCIRDELRPMLGVLGKKDQMCITEMLALMKGSRLGISGLIEGTSLSIAEKEKAKGALMINGEASYDVDDE